MQGGTDMYCAMCGKKIPNGKQDCLNCNIVEISPKNRKLRNEKNTTKKNNFKIFLALFISLIVVSISIFLLNPAGVFGENDIRNRIIGNPVNDVIAALADGAFDDALLLVEYADNDALQGRLSDRLNTVLAEFKYGEIEYYMAVMELNTIEQMGFYRLSSQLDDTRTSINNINTSRLAFNTAKAMFEHSDYVGAIVQFRLVILEDPNFDAAQDGMSKAVTAYRNQIESDVSNHIANDDYVGAIRTLTNALQVLEEDPDFTQSLVEIKLSYVTSAVNEANELSIHGEYEQAILLLRNALETALDDDWLIRTKVDIIDNYATSIIATAQSLLEEYEFDSATTLVNNALHIVPDNERLIIMREDITAARPVCIRDITSVEAALSTSDVSIDNYRNEYTNVVFHSNLQDINIFHSLLDGRFTRLRGTMFVNYGERAGGDNETIIQFELDGVIIESHTIGATTRPILIDFDLTGVNEFRIIQDRRTLGGRERLAFALYQTVPGPRIYYAYFRLYP